MGLRERKKERTRAAILEAADQLAREHGFDRLRVRDLIERIEISEATFFNYFPARSALLDAWLEDRLANAFADLATHGEAGRAGIRRCIRELARDAARAEGLGAAAWRRANLAAAIRGAIERGGLPTALAAARDAGELRRDLEPSELAELLLGAAALAISTGSLGPVDPARSRDPSEAADPAGAQDPAATSEARALRAADLVLDGARRRHERVRLGRGGARPAPVRGG
jgi:AcrR family transcriptional regulator